MGKDVTLLTGFPSFAARKMCVQLLRSGKKDEVFAVVRDKFKEEAAQAMAELSSDEARRLHLLEGDAASMDLGLSGAEYRDLARRITRIHHMARVSYPGPIGRRRSP